MRSRGARGVGSFLVAFFVGPGGPPRLGVVASRRVGSAVERSRAKRRLREIYRRAPRRPAGDLVLVARPGLPQAAWPEVEQAYAVAVGRALHRAGRPASAKSSGAKSSRPKSRRPRSRAGAGGDRERA